MKLGRKVKRNIGNCSNKGKIGEILGSHGGENEDDCLLACCVVYSGTSLPTFQGYGHDYGGSKHSETSVYLYQTTWYNIPEKNQLQGKNTVRINN
jgi:hypothetical protein